ncbi:MAG: hypothetical protein CMF52_03230 [Legionellales bacterium]|nr:hypothetical protein [Legionellales bacterium]|tara:strand:+ start:229 stop:495 length:267 start_codon:yes stop_codon:yes gene_type:complete
MEWLKSTLARWKVQVSFVAGALVVATAYGQCTVEPPPAEEVSNATEAVETTETTAVEVSSVTEGTIEDATGETTTTETTTDTTETTSE